MVWSVLRSFTLSRAIIILAAVTGYLLLPPVYEGVYADTPGGEPWYLAIWHHWDAGWYLSIAREGYSWVADGQSSVAFFPLFPLLLKAFGWLAGGRYMLAGLLLTAAFQLAALFYLFLLVRDEFDETVAGRAVWFAAIFPTAVFFNSVYTESLFLLTSIASFYHARRQQWALAGAWGLLASLTRVTGLLLLLPLLYEYMSRRSFSLKKVRPGVLWLGLIPAGLLIYMAYLHYRFGLPFAFAETQKAGWGHELTPVLGSFTHDLPFLQEQSEPWVIYDFAATALLVAATLAAFRRLPGSFGLYMLLSLLLPLAGGTTKSVSRYALVIFPVFILMALYTRNRALFWALTGVSLALLGAASAAFATGRWVA